MTGLGLAFSEASLFEGNQAMKIRVTTVVVATGVKHDSRVIDYERKASRDWLAKHCFWAFNNGFGVATNNVADEAPPALVTAGTHPGMGG